MRRLLALVLLLSLAAPSLIAPTALAQPADAAVGPGLGESVDIVALDGTAIGSIQVDGITDPFDDFASGSAPLRGYRYIAIEVTVTNGASRPMTVDPGSFRAIDGEGFIGRTAYISSATGATTMLEYGDIGPGESITANLIIEMFGPAQLARLVYSPNWDTHLTVLDLRPQLHRAGEPVPVMDSTGQVAAEMTVVRVADPFLDFDEFSAPSRGSRLVEVEILVENMGTRDIEISPWDISAVDVEGLFLDSASVTAVDPSTSYLAYATIPPGATAQGSVFFTAFGEIPVDKVIYGDLYTREVIVADLAAGLPEVTIDATPVATADNGMVSSADCEGLLEWGIALSDRLDQAVALTTPLQAEDVSTLDPALVRAAADELGVLAQQQRDSNPPPAAEALNTLMAEQFFQAMSSAVGGIADSLETGNAVQALLAQAEAEAVVALFSEGGEADVIFAELEAACPNEIRQLNEM